MRKCLVKLSCMSFAFIIATLNSGGYSWSKKKDVYKHKLLRMAEGRAIDRASSWYVERLLDVKVWREEKKT